MGTCPAVCGFPSIVRASALGKDGHVAPSMRVNVGCIGNGKMGTVEPFLNLGAMPGHPAEMKSVSAAVA